MWTVTDNGDNIYVDYDSEYEGNRQLMDEYSAWCDAEDEYKEWEKELKAKKKAMERRQEIKNNAKAIWLLSDIAETYVYLDAHVEAGTITEDEADTIINEIDKECANITVAEIDRFRKQLERR